MFEQLFTIIAPILFCAAVGFIWARRGFDYPVDFVSRMVMNIGAPCLILASFNEAGIDPGLLGKVAAATLAVLLIMMGFGAILVRLLRLRMTTFLPSVVFANIGNMGLPLCYFAFGEIGLALGLTVFLVVFTLQMSVGLVLASGNVNVLELLKQPVLWATAAAVAMILGDWALPAWLANTVTLLGDITIPLMLITLGVSLASLRVEEWRHSLLFSLVRVAGGFCAGWLVAEWFGLQGVERGVLILQSSMPVAVFNYLLALRYKREPGEVAGMVLLSTLLAFLSLPLVVAYVLL